MNDEKSPLSRAIQRAVGVFFVLCLLSPLVSFFIPTEKLQIEAIIGVEVLVSVAVAALVGLGAYYFEVRRVRLLKR